MRARFRELQREREREIEKRERKGEKRVVDIDRQNKKQTLKRADRNKDRGIQSVEISCESVVYMASETSICLPAETLIHTPHPCPPSAHAVPHTTRPRQHTPDSRYEGQSAPSRHPPAPCRPQALHDSSCSAMCAASPGSQP